MTTPIVQALREQLNAEITYITSQKFESIVSNDLLIDRVWLREVIANYEDRNFDYIIDLQKNRRSTLLARKLTGRYITYDKLNIDKWLLTTFGWDRLPQKHLIDRYFEALKSLNVVDKGYPLRYNIPSSTKVDDLPSRYTAINCGGTYFTKRIPIEVIDRIIEQSNQPCILLGGKDVECVSSHFSQLDNVTSMIGQLSLNESAYVVMQSKGFYTSDSALMHIGAALDVDMTVLWGNTTPIFGMYPYKTLSQAAEIQNLEVLNLSCRPCSKLGYDKCPKGHFKCMRDQL